MTDTQPATLDELGDSLLAQADNTQRTFVLVGVDGPISEVDDHQDESLSNLVGYVQSIATLHDLDPEEVHVRVLQHKNYPDDSTFTTGFDGVDPENGTNPPEGA